jgi:chemotaxis protein histidine kinase CheA
MMSSNEGLAPNNTVLWEGVSELKESYRRLLRAIDQGELELARHLMTVIAAQQSKSPGLSDLAQEAFDQLAIAATTDDAHGVREALESFRNVLRSNSSLPPTSSVCATVKQLAAEPDENSRPSGVTPRYQFEDYSVEAFDQELPDTASLFAVKRQW